MNPRTQAVAAGTERGLVEFRRALTHLPDVGFYVGMAVAILATVWFNREDTMPGTDLPVATVLLPGLVGGVVAFIGIIGVGYAIAAEREDGTVLRAKALPHGMLGYLTGQALRASLEASFSLAIIIIPGLVLFAEFAPPSAWRWLTFAWVLALGLAATLPLGAILGSIVTSANKIGSWGTTFLVALAAVSGIFAPITLWAGWVQIIGQSLPLYWLGLGMRSVFLPDAAAAAEVGGSWRPLATAAVLTAWAVVGSIVAPAVLRRMARRESGSAVEARRERALQRTP